MTIVPWGVQSVFTQPTLRPTISPGWEEETRRTKAVRPGAHWFGGTPSRVKFLEAIRRSSTPLTKSIGQGLDWLGRRARNSDDCQPGPAQLNRLTRRKYSSGTRSSGFNAPQFVLVTGEVSKQVQHARCQYFHTQRQKKYANIGRARESYACHNFAPHRSTLCRTFQGHDFLNGVSLISGDNNNRLVS